MLCCRVVALLLFSRRSECRKRRSQLRNHVAPVAFLLVHVSLTAFPFDNVCPHSLASSTSHWLPHDVEMQESSATRSPLGDGVAPVFPLLRWNGSVGPLEKDESRTQGAAIFATIR